MNPILPTPTSASFRRPALALLALMSLALAAPAAPATARDEKWIPLFNGKDLEGWTPKIVGHAAGEDPMRTFRVADGVIQVRYDGYEKFDEKFGHLFYKTPFRRYRLRIEYRFVGQQCPGGPGWALRNSGVMIHGQSPESMRKDQDFPVSIEVQFLGGGTTGERHTGNLCTPGTNVVMDGKLITQHCTESSSKTYRDNEWVTLEVEALGAGKVTHKVNGETVLTYEQSQLDPNDNDARGLITKQNGEKLLTGGTISLQSESHPIEFRTVEILPLDD